MDSLNLAYFTPCIHEHDPSDHQHVTLRYKTRYQTYVLYSLYNNSQLFAISFVTASKTRPHIPENECIIVFTNLCSIETIYVDLDGKPIESKPRSSIAHHEKFSKTKNAQEYLLSMNPEQISRMLFSRVEFRVTDDILLQSIDDTDSDVLVRNSVPSEFFETKQTVTQLSNPRIESVRYAAMLETILPNIGCQFIVTKPIAKKSSKLKYSQSIENDARVPLISFNLAV